MANENILLQIVTNSYIQYRREWSFSFVFVLYTESSSATQWILLLITITTFISLERTSVCTFLYYDRFNASSFHFDNQRSAVSFDWDRVLKILSAYLHYFFSYHKVMIFADKWSISNAFVLPRYGPMRHPTLVISYFLFCNSH